MMMVVKNQKGQALIELIIFLPLMFSLYGIISGFADAINGSINQQKITRSYFYFRIQNNSMTPRPDKDTVNGWSNFGISMVGWAVRLEQNQPVMPCYKISIPLSPDTTDNCDQAYTATSTQFIRVGTVYGICGATFGKSNDGDIFLIPDSDGLSIDYLSSTQSCLINK